MHARNLFYSNQRSSFKLRRVTIIAWLLLAGIFSSINALAAEDDINISPVVDLLLNGTGFKCSVSVDEASIIPNIGHQGLRYYDAALASDEYMLPQLSDAEFNSLSREQKLQVADKLLTTLFFGYPHDELEAKINSGRFLCTIRNALTTISNSKQQVEEYILDPEFFIHGKYLKNEIHDILARLYVMEHLDEYFLHNWQAYILTQTIMFSPAEELESAHLPDVANIYNWLVMDMEDNISLRYSAYMHMQSLENWRRFRSPEDNGREMLEIFLLDFDDEKVPLTAMALQNWHLDDDHDSLVIGLNENTTPLNLFNTQIYNGFDFYRELVKTEAFIQGVTERIVDFFFPDTARDQKKRVTERIVSSKPKRWQDILLQLVFSKEYLLNVDRAKSAEELFFSLSRKISFKHRRHTFKILNDGLESMNQASMKYKLGKLQRIPLDTLSFANYHKFFREKIVYNYVCGVGLNGYEDWPNDGWTPELYEDKFFTYLEDDPEASMISYIQYLFNHLVQRDATSAELEMLLDHMLFENKTRYRYSYNLAGIGDNGCYYGRIFSARLVMDYLSRLTSFYWFEGVE